jgi:hypothetical protein
MIQNLSNLTKRKEFAQTGPEKVCDKVKINKLE